MFFENESTGPRDLAEAPSAPIGQDQIEDQNPSENQAPLDDSIEDQDPPPDPPRKKRNCGRTGATSIAGRRRSAMNALKHGSCSGTHLIDGESEAEWLLVLHQWRESYAPLEAQNPCSNATADHPAEPPAVNDCNCPTCVFNRSTICAMAVKVAEAEWRRRRSQRNLDLLVHSASGAPFNWAPEQLKMYTLLLRYKTADERTFQRDFRNLEAYVKTHQPITLPESKLASEPEPVPAPDPEHQTSYVVPDANSPTGFYCMEEYPPTEGVDYPYPVVPRPPDSSSPCASPTPDAHPKEDSETG